MASPKEPVTNSLDFGSVAARLATALAATRPGEWWASYRLARKRVEVAVGGQALRPKEGFDAVAELLFLRSFRHQDQSTDQLLAASPGVRSQRCRTAKTGWGGDVPSEIGIGRGQSRCGLLPSPGSAVRSPPPPRKCGLRRSPSAAQKGS